MKILKYYGGNQHPEIHEITGGCEMGTPDVSSLNRLGRNKMKKKI